jgi:hypothetical protein
MHIKSRVRVSMLLNESSFRADKEQPMDRNSETLQLDAYEGSTSTRVSLPPNQTTISCDKKRTLWQLTCIGSPQ